MTVVAIELEDKVFQDLEEASGELNVPSDQMISRIVKNYLHIEKMNKIRRELRGTAEAAGFFSEEDIYREIS
jgi:CRISPR/Cas system CMR subunit Cmr4 (Cas7 group RAMP superfamily)